MLYRHDKIRFWQTLLALLLLDLPLQAQSGLGLLSWLQKPAGNDYAHDNFAPGYRGGIIDPDAGSPGPMEPPQFAHSTFANNPNPRFRVDSNGLCQLTAHCDAWPVSQQRISPSSSPFGIANSDKNFGGDSKSSSTAVIRSHNQPEVDRGVYYRNKLEFAFDGGWLPINIPFVFDVFLGDAYNKTPLSYTLVPLVASLRWQIDDVGGPWIFRGNWDMTCSGSITLIPRGPETRFFSYDMGIRRNFVPHRGKLAPYFDGRAGLGEIDAKEPLGVAFAQGQNFTFTVNLGSGVRYNFNPRYSVSAGLNWMHISNLYLSQPAFSNYGINVYGPTFGVDIRLSRRRLTSE